MEKLQEKHNKRMEIQQSQSRLTSPIRKLT